MECLLMQEEVVEGGGLGWIKKGATLKEER